MFLNSAFLALCLFFRFKMEQMKHCSFSTLNIGKFIDADAEIP